MLACHDACLTSARGAYRPCTSGATGAFQEAVSVDGQQSNGNVSRAFNFADPMIGVRWEAPLLDRLSLDFRGDLGGLPAASRLTWGLVGDVRYWPDLSSFSAQPWLEAGYRLVAYE